VSSVQIVERDFKNKTLYVASEAINKLHDGLLIEAFQACIYSQWQAQEILTAYEVRKQSPVDKDKDQSYVGLFDVLRFTPDLIDELSYVEAFTAPNVAYIGPMTERMMAGPRLHPDKRGESYAPKREKRQSSTMSIHEDLDVWGHKQHHYRAGCRGKPENSVAFPDTVRESVRYALQLNEDMHTENETLGLKHANLLPRCLVMMYPNDIIDDVDGHLVAKRNARPFTEMNMMKQRIYDMQLEEWKKGGKVGPPPVITTLANMGQAVHTDYMTAEMAKETDSGRLSTPASLVTAHRLGRTRLSGVQHRLDNPLPGADAALKPATAIASLRDVNSYHASLKARAARRMHEEQLRQQARQGYSSSTTTTTTATRPRSDLPADYESIPFISSVVTPVVPAAATTTTTATTTPSVPLAEPAYRPGYTMQGDTIVLDRPLRARTGVRAAGAADAAASLSSSSSSATDGTKKRARLSAAEQFDRDERARARLMRSASRGYESMSRLVSGDDDGDHSRSHLYYNDNDDDVPPGEMLKTNGGADDDDLGLEYMNVDD
jgi:hypothetical protein